MKVHEEWQETTERDRHHLQFAMRKRSSRERVALGMRQSAESQTLDRAPRGIYKSAASLLLYFALSLDSL